MIAPTPEQMEAAELRQHYEARREMILSPGWQALVVELTAARAAYADLSAIANVEQLWLAKGRIDQIDYLLGLQKMTDTAFEMLQAEGRI